MTLARLMLAIGMMPYGVSKLFDLQFQVGAWNYARPLGELPGTLLTWAFLGYSPVFQFLMGVFETAPAILLLFARTRRLGALLMFPVLLNVWMINIFLDLWSQTQLISSVLLGLNLFLILYDIRLYLDFLSRLLAKPAPIANRRLRIASKVAGFVVPAAIIGIFLFNFHAQVVALLNSMEDFTGQRQINRAGTWQIVSLRVAGERISAAAGASLYFDFTHQCVYSDGVHKNMGKFQADHSRGTFQISGIPDAGAGEAIQGAYRVQGDRLLLDGQSGVQPVSFVLQRTRWGHTRLRGQR